MNTAYPFPVKKYLQVAKETLEDADCLIKEERIRGAVNRIYYAAFYAVSALLISDKLSTKKHSGVRSLLNKNYVQTKLLNVEYAKFYNGIYDLRHSLDYLRDEVLDPGEIKELRDNAQKMIEAIQLILIEKYKE